MTPFDYLRRNWFLFGILICICSAGIYPKFGSKNGPLNTEFIVKYCATTIIFFISGLSLKLKNIYYIMNRYDIHLFIQLFTFILIPILTKLIIIIIQLIFNENFINLWILKGIITVSCMPPPVSSAVILTRIAGGNELIAIFNSIIGSYIGVVLTPLLLLLNLGITTILPITRTLISVTLTIILPLCLGVFLGNFVLFERKNRFYLKSMRILSNLNQFCLLFIIYTTFCDTFDNTTDDLNHIIDSLDILLTIIGIISIQIIFLNVCYLILVKYFYRCFNDQDMIAILFVSTHKSLTLGIPILRLLYHGYSHLIHISLPLLIYHPVQIILGGLLVGHLKDWFKLEHRQRYKLPI